MSAASKRSRPDQAAAGSGAASGQRTGEGAVKPTPQELGLDLSQLTWERSGEGPGSIEVAFPASPRWTRGDWVLMRVAGDHAGRVLVFDRNEWECFLDGARNGEFDDAASPRPGPGRLVS